MPAVAAKKPTAYREGRADKTKKPSIEIEINPEGEEEEEGMEGQEMDAAKTSRKRSAKGAKSTKAPVDGDCGCGGAKKGKKCTCDGNCGGYAKKMDRSDALTPQEYLAACDLGIQGRSRSYIRARLDTAMNLTPSTVRADLKCGNGSISPGEKCTKGAGRSAKSAPGRVERRGAYGTSGLGGDPFSYKNMANKGAMVNAAALGTVGALVGGTKGALIGAAIGGVAGAGSGALQAGINRATSRAAKRRRLTREFERPIAAEFKRKMESEKNKIRKVRARMGEIDYKTSMKLAEGYDRIRRETRGRYGADSVYAAGFSPELDQLAI